MSETQPATGPAGSGRHLKTARLTSQLLAGVVVGVLASQMQGWIVRPGSSGAHAESGESAAITGALPDQAHAMADVASHFTHLWFAGEKQNWPLATFYLGETRSHLAWAVRLKPVRKTSSGEEVNLAAILESIDNSFLSQIQKSIEASDVAKFKAAYQQTLEGCYGCHKASEKPYLHLQIPQSPPPGVIRFEPESSR